MHMLHRLRELWLFSLGPVPAHAFSGFPFVNRKNSFSFYMLHVDSDYISIALGPMVCYAPSIDNPVSP